jgi:hypothetical protein
MVLFAIILTATILALFKAGLLVGVGAAIVMAVLNWSRIVGWFQGNEHVLHSNPDNIAFLLRDKLSNGNVGVISGIFNKSTNKIAASQNYSAGSLDDDTKERFGKHDVCIVTH